MENQNVSSLNHDMILGKNKRKRKTSKKIVLYFWKQTLKIRNLSVFISPKYDWTKAKDNDQYFASCLETAGNRPPWNCGRQGPAILVPRAFYNLKKLNLNHYNIVNEKHHYVEY